MSEDLRGYKSRAPIIEVRAADLGPVSDVRRAEIARLERVIDGDRQYIKRRVAERDAALAALDRVRALCDYITDAYLPPHVHVAEIRAALDGPDE